MHKKEIIYAIICICLVAFHVNFELRIPGTKNKREFDSMDT